MNRPGSEPIIFTLPPLTTKGTATFKNKNQCPSRTWKICALVIAANRKMLPPGFSITQLPTYPITQFFNAQLPNSSTQWPKELAQVLREETRLLHGGEVTTS